MAAQNATARLRKLNESIIPTFIHPKIGHFMHMFVFFPQCQINWFARFHIFFGYISRYVSCDENILTFFGLKGGR